LTDPADDITRAMHSLERAYLIGVDGVTEVWLVRHADVYETLDDLDDPGLSPRGREQARRLAERVRLVGVTAVYASPQRRALETAQALAQDVRVDPRLAEARAHFTGGRLAVQERHETVVERIRAAVEEAVSAHPGGRVVMVGHGIAILNFLCDVLQLAPGTLRLFPACASISVVRVKAGRRAAGALCDVAHLETMP
jgi:2,3-bisphosphoglycerate-dependent phosphoglycerate mutase